ncbi:MAG: ferritin-like domain-containing protein [Armatimonadota bacterium]|nr:ferritin-like domain-containing protein [Armatimonadota bacterium]MDR5703632.1 ferritin-like domain-containing protein [Armatimonadota bacterium]MDR7435674.1 ferritin-like domain-containing protein [Armatimonadota bacterium]
MGTKGRSILEVDVNTVINELKKAYLDELMAFYSYWITAIVAEGFHGEELTEHFKQEAMEELGHAEKLANRILELGGDPVVHPKDWEAGANAPFTSPRADRTDAEGMVEDQIKAEAGAIEAYNRLAKLTFGKDPVTYHLATELLADEVRHEEFLENLLGKK